MLAGSQSSAQPISESEITDQNFKVSNLEQRKDLDVDHGFRLLSEERTGIHFTNHLNTELSPNSFNLLNGSGVALADYDGDGRCDVFLVAMSGRNKLFRNMGNWVFEDSTRNAGLSEAIRYSSGATFEDIDGDGRLDLLISTFGSGVKTFLNQPNGRFTPLENPSLDHPHGSATLALSDVDGDGDLDLYVTNYGLHTMRTKLDLRIRTVRGKPQVVGRYRDFYKIINGKLVEYGEPDTLYLNNGEGLFSPVSWTDGTFQDENGRPLPHGYRDLGLSAMFRDVNNDGQPDLYVCNDFQTPDRLWINQGSGKFRAIERAAIRVSSYSSMGIDFGDLNRDGRDDFMVVDMLSRTHQLRMTQHLEPSPSIETTGEATWDRPQISRNTLFIQQEEDGFTEIAQFAGLSATEWSWAPVFMDVDLDGYEDILIGNGHAQDNLDKDTLEKRARFPNDSPQQLAILFPELKTPNLAFRNKGNLQFEEVGEQWGFDSTQISNAIALGDLDNDGDQDVIINCLNAPALVYENKSQGPRIAVRLKGHPGNTRGIGARISLIEGDFIQSQEIISGGRYLSGDQAQRTFAITQTDGNRHLEICWRSGLISKVPAVEADRLYEVFEPSPTSDRPQKQKLEPNPEPLFSEITSIQRPHHSKSGMDSRQIQPTWPFHRSNLGSVLAWLDVDQDGDDDLAVSGGSQASLWIENLGQGEFGNPVMYQREAGNAGEAGFASLPVSESVKLVSTANQGTTAAVRSTLDIWSTDGSTSKLVEFSDGPLGPIAIADVDGDADLDIFVGDQSPFGRFPDSSSSYLLMNQDGAFSIDSSKSMLELKNVQGAVFCDWDLDGDPDLIVTSEWGELSWLINDKGNFIDKSPSILGGKLSGIWQGLATGDFNEDGRPDLIACNAGKNTQWSQWGTERFRIYFSTQMRAPETIVMTAYLNGDEWLPATPLEEILPWMNDARLRFTTHKDYAEENMSEILGKHLTQFEMMEINTLETTLLLNLPEEIQKIDLPKEAQWAPSFSPAVADFNNDGHEDIFLSQNLDTGNRQWGRMDAGNGLVLLGNGSGHFDTVSCDQSGILIRGEQRGTALADFNQDGKMDLAVLENGQGVHVYVNKKANPGTRISLKGTTKNPHCIGAKLRKVDPQNGETYGPMKEIQSGSGFGSLNAPALVFAQENQSFHIQITWPDGRKSVHPIPKGIEEVTIEHP